MSRPDLKYWWVAPCLGIALGLLASFLAPEHWDVSKYLWITCVSLVIVLVSLELWKAANRPNRASGDAPEREESGPPERKTGTGTSDRPVAEAEVPVRSALQERPKLPGKDFGPPEDANRMESSDCKERPKIKLTKVAGEKHAGPAEPIVGYELAPPAVGKAYRIRTVRKTVVTTSAVLEIGPGFVRTRNSYYDRQILP